jgi:hypothetical protein
LTAKVGERLDDAASLRLVDVVVLNVVVEIASGIARHRKSGRLVASMIATRCGCEREHRIEHSASTTAGS